LIIIKGDKCRPLCNTIPGCSHYTWKSLDGGTCYLKTGPIDKHEAVKSDDVSSICGLADMILNENTCRMERGLSQDAYNRKVIDENQVCKAWKAKSHFLVENNGKDNQKSIKLFVI
jgi:hypothetical protein